MKKELNRRAFLAAAATSGLALAIDGSGPARASGDRVGVPGHADGGDHPEKNAVSRSPAHEEDAHGGGEHKEAAPAAGGHDAHAHGRAAFKRYGLIASRPGYREFNVRLRRFAYAPSTLRVNLGDRVKLNLDAVDVEHGFSIDGYPVKVRVPEKGYKSVEFTADREGAFRFRCSVTCGSFHPFMIGRLVVGRNRPFWGTLALFLLAPAAALVYLARNGATNGERPK